MELTEAHLAAWAHGARCIALGERVAAELEQNCISVVAMKGMMVSTLLEHDGWTRPMSDADLIVQEHAFVDALRLLHERGYQIERERAAYQARVLGGEGAVVDLHERALHPGFGEVDTRALFRRAARPRHGSSTWPRSLARRASVVDATDAAALAIVHYVKDGLGAFGHRFIAQDLSLLRERGGVLPSRVASRLAEWSLQRAGVLAYVSLARDGRLGASEQAAWAPLAPRNRAEAQWARTMVGLLKSKPVALPKRGAALLPRRWLTGLSVDRHPYWSATVAALGISARSVGARTNAMRLSSAAPRDPQGIRRTSV